VIKKLQAQFNSILSITPFKLNLKTSSTWLWLQNTIYSKPKA